MMRLSKLRLPLATWGPASKPGYRASDVRNADFSPAGRACPLVFNWTQNNQAHQVYTARRDCEPA